MCRRLLRRSAGALLATLCGLGLARTAAAQVPPADPSDVATVDGIVRAYYDVINGPPGAPRQWRRDSTLYMPEVRFVAMSEHDGKPKADVLTPEQFRRAVDADFIKHGFYEVEIGRRTERFGNVVQVRSAYDTVRLNQFRSFFGALKNLDNEGISAASVAQNPILAITITMKAVKAATPVAGDSTHVQISFPCTLALSAKEIYIQMEMSMMIGAAKSAKRSMDLIPKDTLINWNVANRIKQINH